MTIAITTEIKREINESILSFKKLLSKEMSFSEDLRKKDKVEIYTNRIAELTQSLENGYI